MKPLRNFALIAASLALAACSSNNLLSLNKTNVPDATNVPVGNNLALPPDLQLAQPAATYQGYQSNGPVSPIIIPQATPRRTVDSYGFGNPDVPQQARPAAPPVENGIYNSQAIDLSFPADYYAKYGVSRFKAGGKLKSKAEMNEELRQAVLRKKRENNPNYGTIGNVANVLNGTDEILTRP